MKMCMWFWSYDLTVFDRVITHTDLNFANHNLVSATPSTLLKLCRIPSYDIKCACALGFLIELFLAELLPLLTCTL